VLGEERGAHRFHTTDALTASLLLEVGVFGGAVTAGLAGAVVAERVLQLCLL